MTYRGFLTRDQIGLRAPRSRSTNITPENGGVAGHYGGPAQNIQSHSDCLRKWRGWQNYHMDTHGWVDIAYTLGVCDHGYIFAGRGAGVRTAANGTNYGNQNYYAVCWIGGQGETPTQDAVDAFWQAVRMLRSQGKAGNDVKKHKDFKATSCPGGLGAVIDRGMTDGGSTPSDPSDDEGDEIMQRGDNGDGVKAFQRRLTQWAQQAGRLSGKSPNKSGDLWEKFLYWGIDGDFGSTTEGVVKEFQAAYDLPVTGRIGANTGSILAMFATGGGSGGLSQAEADARYAAKSHGTHGGGISKAEADNLYAKKVHGHKHTHTVGEAG